MYNIPHYYGARALFINPNSYHKLINIKSSLESLIQAHKTYANTKGLSSPITK